MTHLLCGHLPMNKREVNMYSIAFYKGRKTGNSLSAIAFRFMDWLTRKVTKGEYSHCELVKPIGSGKYSCFSASYRDGGVRTKIMGLDAESWDLVPIEMEDEDIRNMNWFINAYTGDKYDLWGALGIKIPFIREHSDKWFCSEAVAGALLMPRAYRYSPNSLYEVLTK